VVGPVPVSVGDRPLIRVRLLGISVVEPVEVVHVVMERDRVGFAYRTLPGHPVRGEEAFIVDRDDDGVVSITVRSLTARSDVAGWRAVHPILRVAQRIARRRYFAHCPDAAEPIGTLVNPRAGSGRRGVGS